MNIELGAELRDDANQTSEQTFHVGDPIPVRLGVAEMCRLFGKDGVPLSRSQFYRLEKARRFERFALKPQIGAKAWSGYRVARYLTGDSFSIAIKKAS